MVSPSSSVFSQLLISPDTRSNNPDPVGAGCIRSAASAGSVGAPLGKLAQQPVNAATLSGSSFFSSFSRLCGAAALSISTVSFLLHGALVVDSSSVLADAMKVTISAPADEHQS